MAKKSTKRKNRKSNQAQKATSSDARTRRSARSSRAVSMPFSRKNYMLLIAGLLAITFGYAIMRIENEVDGFISLYIAPVIILLGYLEIIYAILWRPRENTSSDS